MRLNLQISRGSVAKRSVAAEPRFFFYIGKRFILSQT